MSETWDIVVVGAGVMGAATVWSAAQRGARVLGIDQFAVPNDLGSSGGFVRLIRLAYHEHPDYVPLLRAAYAGWQNLELRLKETLFVPSGAIFCGQPESSLLSGARHAADLHQLKIENWTRSETERRVPVLHLPPGFECVFEPAAGFLYSDRAVAGFVEAALSFGAEIHGHEKVLALEAGSGSTRVITTRRACEARHVVLTGGPWMKTWVDDLGIFLNITRQPVSWVQPRTPEQFTLGRFPCFAIEDDVPGFRGLYYGFPHIPGRPGMKVGRHVPLDATTPDDVDRTFSAADHELVRPGLARFLPAADGPLVGGKICLYTLSADEHFVVATHPRQPNWSLACGFSGHGFKFAPVIGEILADLAINGTTSHPINFLSPKRFLT